MNYLSTNGGSIFKIAATYIGTIVGAGFATGQEVLQFFTTFGVMGIWGILLSSLLFFFFGYTILVLGHKLQANSYVTVVRHANGLIIGSMIDIIITIILFGALATMIAGTGAILYEQFNIPTIIGTIFMAIITLVTVLKGLTIVVNAISYVVPFLFAFMLFVTLFSLVNNSLSQEEINFTRTLESISPNWFMSAISYTALNLIIAIAILSPLGAKTKERKTLFWGALVGGLGLGISIVAINYSIMTTIMDSSLAEVPMLTVTHNISPLLKLLFTIVLVAQIYTTAVSNLFGFVSRFSFVKNLSHKSIIILTTITALLMGQIGFSTIIHYFYPIVGYGGAILLIGLLCSWFFKRKEISL
ncbi:YkvI family membrane protein [Aquibacillus rhizosphaerae]|uniref:Membrane protein YkvI n=1 Tax=Aquibacillus rhizosphaerae TaxID=3051431 RepID=A0ABT7L2R0_9BACI|nr:hypothetical protein [Aquibacillus sp. LR5S19]MDL4840149.1 hypothetical protein [Aquibacillus sp. LR5S19]